MPAATHKLLSQLRDPQVWVSLLAALTLLGLGTGAFEPAEATAKPRPAAAATRAVADTMLASSATQKP